jgi:hypothetical protein
LPPLDPNFAALRAAMAMLAARVEAVDIRRYESHPPAVLAGELFPLVTVLLGEARDVVSDVTERCERETARRVASARSAALGDAPAAPHEDVFFERVLDAAVERCEPSSVEAVGDIGFLARLELHHRSERLARLAGNTNHAAIIGECDSALRRIRKALMTIDLAFERAGIGKAQLDYASELEISLGVRRAYGKLRARVKAIGEPSGDAIYAQLRAIGTALATVVGWKGYSSLRVRDRMQMRELQRRLLEWFRTERDPVHGHRLWQDIDCFVRMLADVNQRQELREHDARVIEQAWARVSADEVLSRETLQSLESLEGLDDELDALLVADEREDAGKWRASLARLRDQLTRSRGAA